MNESVPFSTLLNKTLSEIRVRKNPKQGNDNIVFKCKTGECFKLIHEQHCCESVTIDDIAGDTNDLLDTPILQAEESSRILLYFEPNILRFVI